MYAHTRYLIIGQQIVSTTDPPPKPPSTPGHVHCRALVGRCYPAALALMLGQPCSQVVFLRKPSAARPDLRWTPQPGAITATKWPLQPASFSRQQYNQRLTASTATDVVTQQQEQQEQQSSEPQATSLTEMMFERMHAATQGGGQGEHLPYNPVPLPQPTTLGTQLTSFPGPASMLTIRDIR